MRQDRQCTYKRNTGTGAYNHSCYAKATSITDSEGDFAALGNQNAMCMRHIVTCGLPV
jgi:hypothetical protein